MTYRAPVSLPILALALLAAASLSTHGRVPADADQAFARGPDRMTVFGPQLVLDGSAPACVGDRTAFVQLLEYRPGGRRRIVKSVQTDAEGRYTLAVGVDRIDPGLPLGLFIWSPSCDITTPVEIEIRDGGPCVEKTIEGNEEIPSCACGECESPLQPSLFNATREGRDHGVNLFDGVVVTPIRIFDFDTRLVGFDYTLYHQTLKICDGENGQSINSSYNFAVIRTGPHSASIRAPNLDLYPVSRATGSDAALRLPGAKFSQGWTVPEGFFSRLRRDLDLGRWTLTHHSGTEFQFIEGDLGLPGPLVRIREPNGNTTRVNRDTSGRIGTILTDLGQTARFEYADDGRLSSITDHLDRRWRFAYDERGRLVAVTTPDTEYADIPPGREITDADLDEVLVTQGRTTTFSYDDPRFPDHITRITDQRGAVPVEYEYYGAGPAAGRVRVKRINRKDVVFVYDPPASASPAPLPPLEPGNRVTRVIDREGNVTDYEMHGPAGGRIEDPDQPGAGLGKFGLRREIRWTELGKGNSPLRAGEPLAWERRWLQDCDCLAPRALSQPFRLEERDAGGAASRHADEFGRPLSFDPLGMPEGYPTERYEYNDRRQVTRYTYEGFGETIRWEKTYDSFEGFSRELTHAEPRAFDDTPIYRGLLFLHTYAYDERGNRIRHDAPTVTRGVGGEQVITESWTYNAFGQVTSHTDPNGNLTTYAYFTGPSAGGGINAKGEFGGYKASTTRGAAGSADPVTSLTTSYKVNPLGMTTERTDPKGLVYDYEYNDLAEKVREIDAEVTLRGGARVRYETRYVYDGAGNQVLHRRSNVDFDGTPLPNPFIDRSQSFDDVDNLLSSRLEIDAEQANDLVTRYRYDSNDQLGAIEQPEGNRTFRLYDERRLHFKTFYGIAAAESGDPAASYPSDKRATGLDVPFVGFTATTYDARLNEVRTRDGRGHFVDDFYDFFNRRVATSDQNGNGTAYAWDDDSNQLTRQGGAVSKTDGTITEVLERSYYRYDEIGRRYQEVLDIDLTSGEGGLVDPDDGANSSFETLFDAGSRVRTRFDANRNPTHAGYDAADRTLAVTDALENVRTHTYDANSNVVLLSESELPSDDLAAAPEVYDATYVYDELNRRTESHVLGLRVVGGHEIDHPTFYAYDSRHNVRLVEDAEGNFTRSSFDDYDRLIATQRFNGDPGATGVPAGVDELIHYQYRYDDNSRKTHDIALSEVRDPAASQATLYLYDDLDRLITSVYPDADDFRRGSEPPDYLDIDPENPDGDDGVYDRVATGYDESSNIIFTREQRGVESTQVYDPGNRLTAQLIDLPPSVPGITRQEYVYDPLNRLAEARNDYARVKRNYDPLSRLIGETQRIRLDGSGFESGWQNPVRVRHRYDRQSNRVRLLVVSGRPGKLEKDLDVRHDFDPLNRSAAIDAEYFDRPLRDVADYTFLGPRRVHRKVFGNGAALTEVYDVKRRITEHAWRDVEGQVLVGFQYDYDDVDNPLFERFLHDGELYDDYGYNDRYELTGVSYRHPRPVDYRQGGFEFESSFEYDDNFNRKRADFGDPMGEEPNTKDSYEINRANEYTELDRMVESEPADTLPPLHDAAGNMIRFPTRPALGGNAGKDVDLHATWDAVNLLFTARLPDSQLEGGEFLEHYRYDPLRRRIARFDLSDDGCDGCPRLTVRRYVYDGWSAVEERLFEEEMSSGDVHSVADRLERIYVNGRTIDEPLLAAIDGDGDLELGAELSNRAADEGFEYYYLCNRLGSVMGLVEAGDSRRALEQRRYETFGRTGPLRFDNTYSFTGRRLDERTGLLQYRHRYYETGSGRFISRDPLDYANGLNLLGYVLNESSRYRDPYGQKIWTGTETVYWSMWQSAGWHFWGAHGGSWYSTGFSRVRLNIQSLPCCKIKWMAPQNVSKTGKRVKLSGYLFSRDHSWHAFAAAEKAEGECDCIDENGEKHKADGLVVAIGHQYSTAETAKVTASASVKLAAKQGAVGSEANIGVSVEFAPSTEGSWVRTYKLICPTGGEQAEPSVKNLKPPSEKSIHEYHTNIAPRWRGLKLAN